MSDLRDQLEREARKVSGSPDALRDVHRRAERRHRTRRLVAGVTALALVAGVGLGAWTVLRDRGPDVGELGQSPPVGDKWPAEAWPHATREEAEAAQAEADAENPQYVWQTQAANVAEKYAITVLGWHEHGIYFDDGLDDTGDLSALQLWIGTCDVYGGGYEPCEGSSTPGGDKEALLSLERLIRQDRTGVWTVTAVGGPTDLRYHANFGYGRLPIGYSEDRCPTNPAAAANFDAVREAMHDLMPAANSGQGRPETVWKWLDEVSHARQGDPDLFAYHFRNTPLTNEYATWEVTYVNDVAIDERCGHEVRAALTAVEVTFPNADEGGESTALLVWVTHPEGVRLWYATTPGL